MATCLPSTNRRSLRTCTVIELAPDAHSFSHNCKTRVASAGSLMISAIDDARLGIQNGVAFNRATGNASIAFAARLKSISTEISSIIDVGAN